MILVAASLVKMKFMSPVYSMALVFSLFNNMADLWGVG